jgi:hypothetical protein
MQSTAQVTQAPARGADQRTVDVEMRVHALPESKVAGEQPAGMLEKLVEPTLIGAGERTADMQLDVGMKGDALPGAAWLAAAARCCRRGCGADSLRRGG